MPSYISHSIHAKQLFYLLIKEQLLKIELDNKSIDLFKEFMKIFGMGPDILIMTDYKTFSLQHTKQVREFWYALLKYIKDNKLQDNERIMANVYGQVDHLSLDMKLHPFIIYLTQYKKKEHWIKPHGVFEHDLDNYIIDKFSKNESLCYWHHFISNDSELIKMLNSIYKDVYNVNHAATKYYFGTIWMVIYDVWARKNLGIIIPLIDKILNIGGIVYDKNRTEYVKQFLNLEHNEWLHPETGEKFTESFDDLWQSAYIDSCELIGEINNYLYGSKAIDSISVIKNNPSYNTGYDCTKEETYQYSKRYY